MGMLRADEVKTIVVARDIDGFFNLVNTEVLQGNKVLHLHRRKVGWLFAYWEYVALLKLKKPAPQPDTKLKIKIGPITNRPLPRLSLRVGVVSER